MRTLKRLMAGFFVICVFVATVAFALYNDTPVAVGVGDWRLPPQAVSIWILGAFVIGGALGLCSGSDCFRVSEGTAGSGNCPDNLPTPGRKSTDSKRANSQLPLRGSQNRAPVLVGVNLQPNPEKMKPAEKDRKRLIVALDFSGEKETLGFLDRIDPDRCRVKIGKELFTAAVPALVKKVQQRGFEIFLRSEISRYSQHGSRRRTRRQR